MYPLIIYPLAPSGYNVDHWFGRFPIPNGTFLSINFLPSRQCLLTLLLTCLGWVSIPIGSRLVSPGRRTQTAVDNLLGVLPELGVRPLLNSINTTTRWEGRLAYLSAKLTFPY